MFCPNCGQRVAETSSFCTHCGTNIAVAPAQPVPLVTRQKKIYAGFWKRFAALFIDAIIIKVVGSIIGFVIVYVIGMAGTIPHTGHEPVQILSLWDYSFSVIYFVLMESSAKQATIGKMVLGIKVTDLNGARITPLRALGRQFAMGVSFVMLCIGFVMAGFTARKQALHDMLAGTLVVNRDVYADDIICSAPVESRRT